MDHMEPTTRESKEDLLFTTLLRLNSQVIGLGFGLLLGLAIFIATNWLILKGGHTTPSGEYVVGPNLQLLSQFFIGYKVSFMGSLIGFAYGFAVGTLSGAVFGWVYNKIVEWRN